MQNKKLSIALIVFGVILLTGSASAFLYEKLTFSRNNQVVATQEQEENVSVTMTAPAVSTASSTVLVDRSDTLMFPHYQTDGSILISRININWDASGNSATTSIKFGVIASSTPDGSLVDVYYFDRVDFNSAGGLSQRVTLEYTPSLMKLDLNNATTSSFVSNDTDLLTSIFATTTPLLSPRGYDITYPNVGDLVMRIYDQQGLATTTAQVFYQTYSQ
ncbi:MAG: hypothetical protein KKB38_21100 [Gammaproteobacteria bacterium]|nr:hypothetical protein [Gammaproteobacteria bacterium]